MASHNVGSLVASAMKKIFRILVVLAIVGAGIGWFLTAPAALTSQEVAALPEGDAIAGEMVFWAGGCSSCHAAPKSVDDAKKILAGGVEFKTPFGKFIAPNISSSSQHGIGGWSKEAFANAMLRGVSPDGSHYYPAFPYTSYSRMTDKDIVDLWSFMKTLPSSDTPTKPHEVGFPFNIRRGLGLWKLLYLDPAPVIEVSQDNAQLMRGRYLTEGPGHCGACHTTRNLIGGMNKSKWLAGAVSPEDGSRIPNITPHAKGFGSWSVSEIINVLETGFTPEFDSLGSTMADVQLNMAKLPASDREAIAAYLKAIPAHP